MYKRQARPAWLPVIPATAALAAAAGTVFFLVKRLRRKAAGEDPVADAWSWAEAPGEDVYKRQGVADGARVYGRTSLVLEFVTDDYYRGLHGRWYTEEQLEAMLRSKGRNEAGLVEDTAQLYGCLLYTSFLTLAILVPLLGAFVFYSAWQERASEPAARSQSGVPVQRPTSANDLTVLVAVAAEEPAFLLVRLNAIDAAVTLCPVPAESCLLYTSRCV